jgi:MscS family membrane protein
MNTAFLRGLKTIGCLVLMLWMVSEVSWAQDTIPKRDTIPTRDTVRLPVPVAIPDLQGTAPIDELDYMETGKHKFSLSSPYETVVTHLYYLQENNWHPDSAAMTLNIANPTGKEAQEKAIKLKEFLDGAGYFIDVDAIPRNPNYTDTLTGLKRFVLTPLEPEIFLYSKNRGWVYSWTTVQAIDNLHERIYPFGTMKWVPEWSKKRFMGLQIWQFLGVLFFIVFTFLFHKLLTKAISLLLESVLQRFVKKERALEFFTKVARPISLLILFIVLVKVYPALQFTIEINKWVLTAFRIMIPVYVMLIGLQGVNLIMAYFERRALETASTMDDQLVPLVRNLMKGVVVIAAIIYILQLLDVDITAVLGGVAFGSLALALAAQDTIKNLFGSLVIFLDRPFQIGDWIIIGDQEGVVEEVSIRSTRIRTFANSLITVPNGSIASASINNMGARVYRRFVTRVGLHYTTPPEIIEIYVEGIRELVRNHPSTRKDAFEVHFDTMADNSLQVLIYVFFSVPNWTQELEGRQQLLVSVIELAHRLGISFAFPKQIINIGSTPPDPNAPVEGPLEEGAARRAMAAYVAENKHQSRKAKQRPETQLDGSEIDSDAGQGRG